MTNHSRTEQSYQVLSNHEVANVVLNHATGQKCLQSTGHYTPGEVLCSFRAGTTLSYATYLTVQVAEDTHITLEPEFLQYTNHSCDPSVFFDTTSLELICIKEILLGDELTFFYPSTEWEMAQPFVCHCGSSTCLQVINGASNLPVDVLGRYRITDFISDKVRIH